MELDLEARLMGEALILNRSQELKHGDFIELNDLNEPLKLNNQEIKDLDPEIEEGEIIDEPMVDVVKIRDDEILEKIDEYPSFCDYDRQIHINYAYNLEFSCMIRYEHVNANFFPIVLVVVKLIFGIFWKAKQRRVGRRKWTNRRIRVPAFMRSCRIEEELTWVKTFGKEVEEYVTKDTLVDEIHNGWLSEEEEADSDVNLLQVIVPTPFEMEDQ
ncbi:hypothetical protein Tco_0370401 [Tanacetum coccineum]